MALGAPTQEVSSGSLVPEGDQGHLPLRGEGFGQLWLNLRALPAEVALLFSLEMKMQLRFGKLDSTRMVNRMPLHN
jgi:hypothetical protein